jgi:hypothetical protein
MSRKEAPIQVTVQHNLQRDELLELRDQIVDVLEPLGLSLVMTVDGTDVTVRHNATTLSLGEIAERHIRALVSEGFYGDAH